MRSSGTSREGRGRLGASVIDPNRDGADILVTGGAGFIGRQLVDALIARDPQRRVRVLDMRPRPSGLHASVEYQTGSINDPELVLRVASGVRAVVHLAAMVTPNAHDLAALRRANVDGTRSVLGAAVSAGCRLFVHLSSAGVYGPPAPRDAFRESDSPDPRTPYQRSKLEGEQLVRSMDPRVMSVVVFRPAGTYGPGSWLEVPIYRRVQRQRVSIELPGGVVVHPTHVRDVVEAVIAVLASAPASGTVFNIGGERALLVEELHALVAHALGVRRRRVVIPAPLGVGLEALTRPVLALLGRPRPELRALVRGASLSAAVDDHRFRSRYPDVPTVSLDVGLREHLDWASAKGLLDEARRP